ncbi:LuxR C-terminal-related transcriptional regulator [Hyphococcus sp. DH-69]|uniref:helix-turn-helix transcriptional regulator n=1 Tax=Hyphococcus formosus TaxID=3143534 RepID=UPI00398B2799
MQASQRNPMEVCSQMLACRKFEDVADKILRPLAECVSAQTASFRQFHLNGKSFAIGKNACHQVADRSHQQYAAYFYRQDPVLQFGMAPGGRLGNLSRFGYDLFCLADICDYRRLIRSEYYQEFFEPNHIHHVLVLAFRLFGNRDQVALLGFHRPSDAPNFTKQDVIRARYFAPAALSALHGLTVENALVKNRTIIESLERASKKTGVVLIDRNGTVVYANEKGAASFSIVRDEFGDYHVDGNTEKLQQVTRACIEEDWRGTKVVETGKLIKIRADCADNLSVRIQPLMRDRGIGAFLVMTDDDEPQAALLGDQLSSLGLTAREQDITRLLGQGASNKDIAADLGISVRTTENHLRSIYAKVGVNSRSQMISRLFNLT